MNSIETLTVEQLCQLMLDMGKAQSLAQGFKWDNRHPTYCEIYAAFRSNDLEEARRIYAAYFC